jgi:hypothetical protein
VIRPQPWEKRRTLGRGAPTLSRRKVLILCEAKKSSRLYFEGFRLDPERVDVETVGTGLTTDSLVQEAIKRQQQANKAFDAIWCVFDRDSFPAQNFN